MVAALVAGPPAVAWSGDPPLAAIAIVPNATGSAEKLAAADLALQGGRLIEAQALLDQIGDKPEGPDADKVALLRAELLIANGRSDDARALLAGMAGQDVPACRLVTAHALADMQSGQSAAAEQRLDEQRAACDGEPVFWAALGQVALASGRPPLAVEAYRRATGLQPDNDLMRNDLAVALIANGDAAAAAEILGDLARRRPADRDVMTNLDFASGMMGRMPERRDADDGGLWSNRLQSAGLGARRAGRTALAEALFAQALLSRPRHDAELWRQYSEVSGEK